MEEFFKHHQFTFTAIGAIGTMFAVIMSLYLGYIARKKEYSQITVLISKKPLDESIAKNRPVYIVAKITNTGLMPIRLDAFCNIKIPFTKKSYPINTLDKSGQDILIPKKDFPVTLKAKYSEIFFLSTEEDINEIIEEITEKHSYSFWWCFFKIVVLTDDGREFKAKISKDIKKKIINIAKSTNKSNDFTKVSMQE